jgi:DNA repair photolyase
MATTFSALRGQAGPAEPALFDASAVVRTFDTPEFRGVTFYEVEAKSLLNRVPNAAKLPFKWTINAYRGCSHACTYCFARPTHTFLGFDAGRDFESRVVVKVNAAELLRRELRRPSWRGEHIAMGTNTDPYQRCEGRYRLTRSVLEVLLEARNPCSVLTKSPLLTRDLDLMVELQRSAGFAGALSIGTLDEEVWQRTEPGTPHPRARLDAVRALNEAGVPCGVLIAPVLPGISDRPKQLREVTTAAVEAGATYVTGITLHLRPGVKEEFLPWLDETYPELSATYRRMSRGSNAPRRVQSAISACIAAATVKATGGAALAAQSHRQTPSPPREKVEEPPRRKRPAPVQLQLGLG